jgi:hypothetical protein
MREWEIDMPLDTPKRQAAEAVQKAILTLCPGMSFSDPDRPSHKRIANEFDALTSESGVNKRILGVLQRLLEAVHIADEERRRGEG